MPIRKEESIKKNTGIIIKLGFDYIKIFSSHFLKNFLPLRSTLVILLGFGAKINVRAATGLSDSQDPTMGNLLSDGFDECFSCGSNFLFAFDIDTFNQA